MSQSPSIQHLRKYEITLTQNKFSQLSHLSNLTRNASWQFIPPYVLQQWKWSEDKSLFWFISGLFTYQNWRPLCAANWRWTMVEWKKYHSVHISILHLPKEYFISNNRIERQKYIQQKTYLRRLPQGCFQVENLVSAQSTYFHLNNYRDWDRFLFQQPIKYAAMQSYQE